MGQRWITASELLPPSVRVALPQALAYEASKKEQNYPCFTRIHANALPGAYWGHMGFKEDVTGTN